MPKYTIIEKEEAGHSDFAPSMAPPAIRSGRKQRIVIACVMMDVPIVVEPVIHYQADRVHLIYYTKNHRGSGGQVYQQFYDEAVRQIRERTDATVIGHDAKVYDYHVMMRTMLEIVSSERRDTGGIMDIYVNISAGSTEYSAAAMLICMQNRNLTAFTVRTDEYMIGNEDLERLLYKDGRPVGFSASVEEPEMIVTFDPEKQDAQLVACLGVLKEEQSRKRNVYVADVINGLKIIGAWNYEPDRRRGKTDDEQKELMHLRRAYLEPMAKKGWVVKNELVKGRWDITSEGEAIIDVYHGLK